MSSEYGAAGRLLNALRQECVHQLGVPMDDLRLVTAWDRSTLQVSKSGCRWPHNIACATLCGPVLHPVHPFRAAG